MIRGRIRLLRARAFSRVFSRAFSRVRVAVWQAASSVREQKASLDAGHRQQQEQQATELKEHVNATISQRFVAADSSRRMLQHPHYSEVSAVVADVTSAISREIASSPARHRRPPSALGMSGGASSKR